jgi:hypothetical protein
METLLLVVLLLANWLLIAFIIFCAGECTGGSGCFDTFLPKKRRLLSAKKEPKLLCAATKDANRE